MFLRRLFPGDAAVCDPGVPGNALRFLAMKDTTPEESNAMGVNAEGAGDNGMATVKASSVIRKPSIGDLPIGSRD